MRKQRRKPLIFVVTGANRGLGLEFARQLSRRGDRVIASARHPEAARELAALPVRVESLEIADEESLGEFARRLAGEPVDVLINNAAVGVAGPGIEALSMEDLARVLQINAVGPLAVTQALLPNLRAGRRKLVVNLTSELGSIARNDSGGWYAYRAAKAALNQLTRTLAHELAPEGFTCVSVSPGWVRTDMGGAGAPLSPEESVSAMIELFDRLTPADTGRFFDRRGQDVAW